MYHYVLCFIICFGVNLSSYGQKASEDFELYKTFPRPNLKDGYAMGIMFDESKLYFAISFDFNPSYVDIYRISDWTKIHHFKIKGYVLLDLSYFSQNSIYLYKNKSSYVQIDLDSKQVRKIRCENTPKGCLKLKPEETMNDKVITNTNSGETYLYSSDYLIIQDFEQIKICLKKK